MGQTLEQRVKAIHHIVYDHQAEPYPRMSCWCGESAELDWSQGDTETVHRIVAFLAKHKACKPKEQA